MDFSHISSYLSSNSRSGWREKLLEASFRGVPFKVEEESAGTGRRVETHEYPNRDKPYTEDLGKVTFRPSITAYVVGDDCFDQRDRLIDALNKPGPGTLVHPTYGEMKVCVDGEVRVSTSKSEGRIVRFDLKFVEAGELSYPTSGAATAQTLMSSCSALDDCISDSFSGFSIDGVADFVQNDVIGNASIMLGYMRWEGVSDGLKVTAGSVIQRDDLVQYTATADATSSGGVLRAPITCSTTGAVGNADDGTALILVTPVNGLPSSGVADTLTGGFDTEDLETWRARVIERYYWTPQGGADGDYVVWAKEVPGITRAWTYRHWMGTGTVGVMIASSDLINPIPEESTETAARQHIGPLAPVAGSDLYVFRPVAHKVDFHIRVTPDTPEIRAAITAELRSFLLRDGYPQGELKVSRISEAISGANGEYSHQLLAPADNISIAKNELAVLGTISWT
ncbi:baseplate J/gp47 family protein [Escherichia coli]|uniref:baseplate J/gp47 family protein n=24 Tax=Escherichia coli TaxID=562 RepID=UPI000DFAEE36|nr:baseplate J/gp47 family protein [Escherichia coli]STI90505.1 putative phage baseplate protein [Escherichia coli]